MTHLATADGLLVWEAVSAALVDSGVQSPEAASR
jgi:hypothetical protein